MDAAYKKTCRACLLESGADVMFPLQVGNLRQIYFECTTIEVSPPVNTVSGNTVLLLSRPLSLINLCPVRYHRTTQVPRCCAILAGIR